MYKEPEVNLSDLRKGDCFMYNRQPCIVKKTFYENHGFLKIKTYICRMKFDDYDFACLGDTDVYRISKNLFDILIQNKK